MRLHYRMDERNLHYRGVSARNVEAEAGMRSLQMSSDFHDDFRYGSMVTRKYCCASGLAISVLGIICGVLLGHFAIRGGSPATGDAPTSDHQVLPGGSPADGVTDVEDNVMKFLDSYDYETVLRTFVEMPKLGGTDGDRTSAEYVAELWRKQGLQDVHLTPYKAYFSHPDPDHLTGISIIDDAGSVVYSATREETNSTEPYLAYSAGTGSSPVRAEVVYANYGRPEDFDHLRESGVNVSGKIAVIRFGRVFRGNKVKEAELRGASAAILYPDPADYALQPRRPFPESMSLPASAVSSGTLALLNGDPLTPIYPATVDVLVFRSVKRTLSGCPCVRPSCQGSPSSLRHLKKLQRSSAA